MNIGLVNQWWLLDLQDLHLLSDTPPQNLENFTTYQQDLHWKMDICLFLQWWCWIYRIYFIFGNIPPRYTLENGHWLLLWWWLMDLQDLHLLLNTYPQNLNWKWTLVCELVVVDGSTRSTFTLRHIPP